MRFLGVFALFLMFFVPGLAATADKAPGLSWTCDELNARWPTYHADLKVSWPLAGFTCPSPMASFVEAIALLHDLSHPSGGAPTADYYSWLGKTAKAIDYADVDIGAGAMAHYHGTGIITIMKPFFSAPLTQRAAMLVHEGRHAMWPADPGHVTCDHGDSQGKDGACDAEFHPHDWGGSGYSWGWVFMWHLMEANAVPADHDRIAWLLKWELNNRFNRVDPQDRLFFMNRWGWDGK
jgi:hypothetical protein